MNQVRARSPLHLDEVRSIANLRCSIDRNPNITESKTTILLGFGIGVGVVFLAWGLKAYFEGVS